MYAENNSCYSVIVKNTNNYAKADLCWGVNEQALTFTCPYLNEDSLVRTHFSKVRID